MLGCMRSSNNTHKAGTHLWAWSRVFVMQGGTCLAGTGLALIRMEHSNTLAVASLSCPIQVKYFVSLRFGKPLVFCTFRVRGLVAGTNLLFALCVCAYVRVPTANLQSATPAYGTDASAVVEPRARERLLACKSLSMQGGRGGGGWRRWIRIHHR